MLRGDVSALLLRGIGAGLPNELLGLGMQRQVVVEIVSDPHDRFARQELLVPLAG